MERNHQELDDEPNKIFDTATDLLDAKRYRQTDNELVQELEALDKYLEHISSHYANRKHSLLIWDKLVDTKDWIYKNRRTITVEKCHGIQQAIKKFLNHIDP